MPKHPGKTPLAKAQATAKAKKAALKSAKASVVSAGKGLRSAEEIIASLRKARGK